ncbi:MAG: TAXI family TRAP transporter solute-binding subunit [Geminicoccaceae bacterium]
MLAQGTFWRFLAMVGFASSLQFGALGYAFAQDANTDRTSFELGTATTGGTYHPVGVALSTLIKLKLLPKFDIDLTAVNTDGSQQNAELLRNNDIQFAIISALAGHDARTGGGPFEEVGADENLRAIATLWLSTDHLLVRKDAVESGTIEDFLGLEGRRVSMGRAESGTRSGNRTLMLALGVDIDSTFDLAELGYAESAAALTAGEIDGMSVSGGLPIGAVQTVLERLEDDVVILEVSDEQLRQIDGGRRLWQRVVIPAETYPDQDRDIYTIGTPNILAVRADVDEEVVYQITKTIFEELDYLHGLHPTTRQISLEMAVSNLPLPLHEGAVRYFEEEGAELPPPPVELASDLLERYPSVADARAASNRGVVTMFTGIEGDSSTRAVAELAAVLNAENDDVRILATSGGGIGRNLTDLLYLKGVDTAFVRADVLDYAQEMEVYAGFENQVNYISEMFSEEVYLLVGGDIAGLDDLAGKKVNLGAPESGARITASIILSQLGISAETTGFEPRMAIEKLKQGEIEGAFFVGGNPMPLLQQIDANSGLKLIALPEVQYGDNYRAAEIFGLDYPNLMSANATLPTIAVRTALLTYAWRPDSVRYQALEGLTDALFRSLLTLHDQGFHPKWSEVDPTATFAGWQQFPAATRWIDDNQGTVRRIAEEGRLRLQQLAARRAGAGGGRPQPIESDDDAASTSEPDEVEARAVEAAVPSTAVTQQDGEAIDAVVVPTPIADPTQTTGQAGGEATISNQPLSNGVYRGSQAAETTPVPSDSRSNDPTTNGNSPTF